MNIAFGIAMMIGLGIASAAPAQPAQQQIRAQLYEQGFRQIRIASGHGRIKVAAQRGPECIHLVYDGDSGRLLDKAMRVRRDDRRVAQFDDDDGWQDYRDDRDDD